MNLYIKNTFLNSPSEFSFPFPPYDIQKDFMKKLYSVLEDGKCGIFESPTGTGKSLSIICGALQWLVDHENRNKEDLGSAIASIEKELSALDATPTDDWLTVQSKQAEIDRYRDELKQSSLCIESMEQAILKIKQDFQNKRDTAEKPVLITKKFTASKSHSETDDEVDDADMILEESNDDDDNQPESESSGEDNEYKCTKIYFCSRTHSQLAQFIGEVKRTPFKESIRTVPLASRQSLCVNPNVKKLKNLSLINERCLELQKNKQSKVTQTGTSKEVIKKRKCSGGCPFNNKINTNKLSDEIVSKIQDIEELVSRGQEISACPYYAARASVKRSQLVVVPYNILLHKSTREASKISLKGNIVIIDEAHNLLDAIGSMHSFQINGVQLCLCHSQLSQYRDKFVKLFSANNLLNLNQLISVTAQLITMIGGKGGCNPNECSRTGIDSKMYTLPDFMHMAEIDNYNLYKLLSFCHKSKLSFKLQGFAEKYQPTVNPMKKSETGLKAFLQNISAKNNKNTTTTANVVSATAPQAISDTTNNPIMILMSFLESLTNHCEDGRVLCARQATVRRGVLKFLLLNPAAHFEEIVKEARSVVVAGGTMQPYSEFQDQLFKNAGAELSRITNFSCGHVIPPENILPIVLCSGSSGKQLDYSYQARGSLAMMNEVGRILDNVCSVVPGGIVCFFPSYDYEQLIYDHLTKFGVMEKLSKKKKLFREPKKSSEVDAVLVEYAKVIADDKKNVDKKPNGCLLFSVVGGKLSEGLNFSDDLGRCVLVVGLPYPNIKSPELQERMSFLEKTAGSGSGHTHYENLCMKAVNQSIGRAVRYKNDYAAVLLLDHRYSKSNIQLSLPQWMKKSLIICDKFGPAFGSLTKFFKTRKEN